MAAQPPGAGGGAAAAEAGPEQPEVVSISCGSSHTVALLSCGVVVAFGRGEDGQLGLGHLDNVAHPTAIAALTDTGVSRVVCGAEYTVAVRGGGSQASSASSSQESSCLMSWGWGDFGRLGHGSSSDVFLPQLVSFFSGRRVSQIACGDTHTLVVVEDRLYAFGRNANGQLGLGHTNDQLSPKEVDALKGHRVVSVACGAEHSLVATAQGQAYSWGWGRYGNLGDGHTQDRYLPVPVQGLQGVAVASVEAGWRHSAAVSGEGRVYTFGWSKYGQLGHGDYEDQRLPKLVSALAGVVVAAVAGGWRHTMAASSDGRLWGWGWNNFGQLGVGDAEDRNAPTLVAGLASVGGGVRQLACGWRHTLAVTADGQVFSWGRGVNGQLGHGDEEDRWVPTRLGALCRGAAARGPLLATASAAGGHALPADRYAVVPDNEPAGANGCEAEVPSMPLHASGGPQDEGAGAGGAGPPGAAGPGSAAKRQRTGGAD